MKYVVLHASNSCSYQIWAAQIGRIQLRHFEGHGEISNTFMFVDRKEVEVPKTSNMKEKESQFCHTN